MTAMENGSYHGAKHRNGDAITETPSVDDVFDDTYKEKDGPKPPMILVWRNIILMTLLHMGALYGLTLIPSASALTLAWTAVCYLFSALSVTAGAHRLWCHRSYKASLPLRIFLALCNSMAFQNDIYEWSRDHRAHHKYSETDADPHNAKRGFFFSHVGWLLVRKHPDVIEKGQKLDVSDLKADKVVMFQRRNPFSKMTAMENGSYHGAKHRNGDAITETPSVDDVFDDTYKEKDGPKPPMILVWRNIILMTLLHMGALYGLTLIPSASALTLAWTAVCYLFSALSVTAGAHRLWCHRSYKASLPLRIFLALCNSMAFQNDIYEWSRDHRAHHKYSETDADPHNAKRGFFFSHIGWLLVRKHPDVIEKGQKLDVSDLKADKVVMFQRR
uniref:stearoyl-CoA desaturase b n=1 Tax=Monopterus albus TaxID=43700 RepID=UPI0009B33669|nr:uncharacterized protein LOC109961932 [Monopterus albus]